MKKLNNKGFSLVELIIVIAIMAILVGVVGTQVIPYLENSRKAKDTQIFSAWNTAAVSAYSTEAGNIDAAKTYKVNIPNGSAITVNAFDAAGAAAADAKGEAAIKKTFCELTNLDATAGYAYSTCASKAGKDVINVLITINGDDGQVVTTITNSNSAKYSFDPIENK